MGVLGAPLAGLSFGSGRQLPRLAGKPLSTLWPSRQHQIWYTHIRAIMNGHGDLNNSHAVRPSKGLAVDPAYAGRAFDIATDEDEPAVRGCYRPFLLPEHYAADDWVAQLELSTALKLVESEILEKKLERLKILVLYGSLRSR